MKKIASTVLCFLSIIMFIAIAQAEIISYTPALTLLDAVTSTGTGDSFSAGFFTGKLTCFLSTGGTAPISINVNVQGSIDGSTFVDMLNTDHTYTLATANTAAFSIINTPARYFKGKYVSKSGGDATTSVTMKCIFGGN